MNRKPPELSIRLQAIANMVSVGIRVADVGCDHGYVAIYLAIVKHSPHVLAMDLRNGPLLKAKEHIEEYGLTDKVEPRLSDGISALKEDEVEGLVIAGMGSRLMIHILEEGSVLSHKMKEIVLEPQSEIHLMRQYLTQNGYRIDCENMVEEDGKFYPILHVIPGQTVDKENRLFDMYGEYLLTNRNMVLYRYLLKEKNATELLMKQIRECADKNNNRPVNRIQELTVKLNNVMTALEYYKDIVEGGVSI